jgi:hypothetical protein
MVNEAVKNARLEAAKLTIERFKKLPKAVLYSATVGLDAYITKVANYETAIAKREADAAALNVSRLEVKDIESDLAKFESSFLVLTAEAFGKESDEYEWAGGTRPSVAAEKAKVTRLEKQQAAAEQLKAEEERLKAEEEKRKADKAQQKANEESLKVELERLKAELAQRKQGNA